VDFVKLLIGYSLEFHLFNSPKSEFGCPPREKFFEKAHSAIWRGCCEKFFDGVALGGILGGNYAIVNPVGQGGVTGKKCVRKCGSSWSHGKSLEEGWRYLLFEKTPP
jgi:hypothetical protein